METGQGAGHVEDSRSCRVRRTADEASLSALGQERFLDFACAPLGMTHFAGLFRCALLRQAYGGLPAVLSAVGPAKAEGPAEAGEAAFAQGPP